MKILILALLIQTSIAVVAEGKCTTEKAKSAFLDTCTVYRNFQDKTADFKKLKEGCKCITNNFPIEKLADPDQCAYSFETIDTVLGLEKIKAKCL